MKVKLYSYKGCGSCKKALKFLAEQGVKHGVLPIRETPPSPEELRQMAAIYNGDLGKLFNRSGTTYRELKMKDRLPGMPESEQIALLASHGNLVKRPFALVGATGMLDFKEDEWREKLAIA